MMDKAPKALTIAVIGCGKGYKKLHEPAIFALERDGLYKPVLFCDLNLKAAQEAAAQFENARAVTDSSDVFNAAEIDAVLIFASAQTHYELGLQALKAGKHLLTEKPPAPAAENLLEMIEFARAGGCIAACGFNRRFYAGLNKALEIIGDRGLISALEACFHKNNKDVAPRYGAQTWFGANAIHSLDFMIYAMLPDLPVHLHSLKNALNAAQDSNFSVLLEWPSKAQGILTSNNAAGSRKESYAIHGHNQSCFYEGGHLTAAGDVNLQQRYADLPENMGFEAEHREFAQAVISGRKPRHGIESAYAAVKLTNLIERGYSGALSWSELKAETDGKPAKKTLSSKTRKPAAALKSSDKPGLLIYHAAKIQPKLELLNRHFEIYNAEAYDMLRSDQRRRIQAVLQAKGGNEIPATLIDDAPDLRIMAAIGASLRKFSPDVFIENDIAVVNASPVYAKAVAEFTLMQMLAARRHGVQAHDMMRKGGWLLAQPEANLSVSSFKPVRIMKKIFFKLRRIANAWLLNAGLPPIKTINDYGFHSAFAPAGQGRGGRHFFEGTPVALIGMGPIAQLVIKHLQHFKCQIAVYSEHMSHDEASAMGVKKLETLDQAMKYPVISLHRGLNDHTRGCVSREKIELIAPGSVFINTARAELVDMDALYERLRRRDIYACLDVFDPEPLPAGDRLRSLSNVFLTPHISGSVDAMYSEAADYVIDQLIGVFSEGREPAHAIVDLNRLKAMT